MSGAYINVDLFETLPVEIYMSDSFRLNVKILNRGHPQKMRYQKDLIFSVTAFIILILVLSKALLYVQHVHNVILYSAATLP